MSMRRIHLAGRRGSGSVARHHLGTPPVAQIKPAFLGELADVYGVAMIVGLVGVCTLLLTLAAIHEREATLADVPASEVMNKSGRTLPLP